MVGEIVIEGTNWIGWQDVFLILALRCCRPALAPLGVPSAMAINPEPLVAMACQVLEVGMGDWPGLWYPEGAFQRAINDAFHVISSAYDVQTARELRAWAERTLVDHAQIVLWRNWETFFLSLTAAVFRGEELTPPPPLLGMAQRIRAAVLAEFGDAARERDDELLEIVDAIGFSAWEARAIALQVDQPGDFPERDVVTTVKLALGRQHAYRVWQQLDPFLSPAQRAEMGEWYRLRMRPTSGLPVDLPPAVSEP
jgi:hypothetical protein